MTYPHGPGRPAGPYGGYPGHGYPARRGGHGQRAQPPYGRYGPPPGGYGYSPAPFGQAGPGGPPPWPPRPRKSRVGLWVGLSSLAAGLVIFLVTGLLAPGFLLDEQKGTRSPGAERFAGPRQLARALVDGVNARDRAALYELTCSTAPPALDDNIENIGRLSDVELTIVRRLSADTAVARLELTFDRSRMQVLSDFRREGGTWCWQDWNPADELASI